jgi:hypothetical protein
LVGIDADTGARPGRFLRTPGISVKSPVPARKQANVLAQRNPTLLFLLSGLLLLRDAQAALAAARGHAPF